MKTTLDIPDALLRQVKARAAMNGQTMRVYVVDALQAKIRSTRADAVENEQPAWRHVFGALRRNRKAVREIQAIIDQEFETINPDDWK